MTFKSKIAFDLSVLLLSLVSIAANAQSRTPPNVDSFIEETIVLKFAYINTAYVASCEHLMEENIRLDNIKKEYDTFSIKLVSRKEAIEIAATTKDKWPTLNSLSVTWQGRDTCNVDIASLGIVLRGKERSLWKLLTPRARFVQQCRGTMGIIPTARFVYDYKTRKWQMSSFEEIRKSLIVKS